MRSTALAITCLLGLAACDDATGALLTTQLLPTSEITLACTLRSNGDAVLVKVSVGSTYNDARELGEGDRILASAADAPEQALVALQMNEYALLLPTAEDLVTLSLARPVGTVQADVQLPPPFALSVPAGPVPGAEPIELAWEQGVDGDTVKLDVSGLCVSAFSRMLTADTGSYVIQPGDLDFSGGGDGCELQVSLTRTGPRAELAIGGRTFADRSQIRTAVLAVTR